MCDLGCKQKILPVDIEQHASVCPAVLVNCEAKHMSCSWQGKRGDKPGHESSCFYVKLGPVVTPLLDRIKDLEEENIRFHLALEELNQYTDEIARQQAIDSISQKSYVFRTKSVLEHWPDDRDLALAIVKRNANDYALIDAKWKGDKAFILAACANDSRAFAAAPASIRADKDFVLKLLSHRSYEGERILAASDPILKADKEVVCKAIEKSYSPSTLEHVATALLADKEVILAAIKHYRMRALKFADPVLRADKDIVRMAFSHLSTNDEQYFDYVDKDLFAVMTAERDMTHAPWHQLQCLSNV